MNAVRGFGVKATGVKACQTVNTVNTMADDGRINVADADEDMGDVPPLAPGGTVNVPTVDAGGPSNPTAGVAVPVVPGSVEELMTRLMAGMPQPPAAGGTQQQPNMQMADMLVRLMMIQAQRDAQREARVSDARPADARERPAVTKNVPMPTFDVPPGLGSTVKDPLDLEVFFRKLENWKKLTGVPFSWLDMLQQSLQGTAARWLQVEMANHSDDDLTEVYLKEAMRARFAPQVRPRSIVAREQLLTGAVRMSEKMDVLSDRKSVV